MIHTSLSTHMQPMEMSWIRRATSHIDKDGSRKGAIPLFIKYLNQLHSTKAA